MRLARRIKALSPVISVLLLVIMAAVASVMLYVWFSGYFSSQATKAAGLSELSITIQRVMFTNYNTTDKRYQTLVVVASIHNSADETVNISSITIQVNGQEIKGENLTLTPNVSSDNPLLVQPGRAATIAFTCNITGIGIDHGTPVTIVIMASGKGKTTDMDYQSTYAYSVTAP